MCVCEVNQKHTNGSALSTNLGAHVGGETRQAGPTCTTAVWRTAGGSRGGVAAGPLGGGVSCRPTPHQGEHTGSLLHMGEFKFR